MAAIAGHALLAVRTLRGRHARAPGKPEIVEAAARNQLRARRFWVVGGVLRIHAVLHQRDAPFELRVERRALVERAAAPLEAPPPVGRAQEREVGAAWRRGRA